MAAVIIWCTAPAAAQFLPQLQASTPEEFDAYLDVMEAAAGQRAGQARRFLTVYPRSDLRLPVYEVLAEACRKAGDAAGALRAARAGLEIAPEYIPLLTLVGLVEANQSARPVDARSSAERALGLLERAKAPRRVDAESWQAVTARLKAENLGTLGLVAFKAGDTAEAIRQFEASVAAFPLAPQQYRLGVLYSGAVRASEARRLLERAAMDPEMKDRAQDALSKLASR